MEYIYTTTWLSLVQALLAGVGMGIYYDIFRLRRRMFSSTELSVALQDLFFWISSAVVVFFLCIRLNGGYIRIYFVFFCLVGWLLYFLTAGKLAFMLVDGVSKSMNRVFEIIRKKITRIVELIYSKISS